MASNEECWTRFAEALGRGVEGALGGRATWALESKRGGGVDLSIYSLSSHHPILEAALDGESIEVLLAGEWVWRWQDATDDFPNVDDDIPAILAELALSYIEGRGRAFRTVAGRKLHIDLSGGRFVTFGSSGRLGSISSSNIG